MPKEGGRYAKYNMEGKLVYLDLRKFKLKSSEFFDFDQCTSLETLYVSNISEFHFQQILNIPHLIFLSLRNVKMSTIPTGILEMTQLEGLEIIDAGLVSISGVGKLNKLKRLVVAINNLTYIEEEVFGLKNLEVLDYNECELEILPEEITTLSKLSYLFIAKNKIEVIPKFFWDLNLKNYEIQDNPLKEVSQSHDILTLEQIVDVLQDAYDRTVSDILLSPQSLIQKQRAEIISGVCIKLDLSNLALKFITPLIYELSELKELNLSNNLLTELPDGIGKLQKLGKIYVHQNKLKYLPNDIVSSPRLNLYDVSSNQLVDIPSTFGDLGWTNHSFANNNLTEIPEWITRSEAISTLILNNNKISDIKPFVAVSSLMKLDLESNQIKVFPEEILDSNPNLREVKLSQNPLHSFPIERHENKYTEISFTEGGISIRGKKDYTITLDKLLVPDILDIATFKEIDFTKRWYNLSEQLNGSFVLITIDSIIKQPEFKVEDHFRDKTPIPMSKNATREDYITSSSRSSPKIGFQFSKKDVTSTSRDNHSQLELLGNKKEAWKPYFILTLSEENFENFDEWMNNLNLLELFTLAEKVDMKTNWTDDKIVEFVNATVRSKHPVVKQVANIFYDDIFITNPQLFSKDDESKVGYIGYLLIGALLLSFAKFVPVLSTIFENLTDLLLTAGSLITLYFLIQFYQGLTIRQFGEDIISRVETSTKIFGRSPRLLRFLSTLTRKLKSSLSLLIAFFWIFTIITFDKTVPIPKSVSDTIPFLSNIILISDFVSNAFGGISLELALDFIAGSFIFILFESFLGTLLRITGIMSVFWAVYKGGWKIIIFPSDIEDRKSGAKLDWYERLALPIGVIVALIAILLDGSDISIIPISVFKLGILVGGVMYLILDSEDRLGFIFAALYLVLTQLILAIFAYGFTANATILREAFLLFPFLLFLEIGGAYGINVIVRTMYENRDKEFNKLEYLRLFGKPPLPQKMDQHVELSSNSGSASPGFLWRMISQIGNINPSDPYARVLETNIGTILLKVLVWIYLPVLIFGITIVYPATFWISFIVSFILFAIGMTLANN